MTYGPTCVSEMKKYKFFAKGDDVKCRNRLDTCERSLCECDKMLAQSHSSTAEGYDQKVRITEKIKEKQKKNEKWKFHGKFNFHVRKKRIKINWTKNMKKIIIKKL